MKTYWLSWDQKTKDWRPKNSPPNQSVLAWWASFWYFDSTHIVAVVQAESHQAAAEIIRIDWPDFDGQFRFIEEIKEYREDSHYKLEDWMKARLKPIFKPAPPVTPPKGKPVFTPEDFGKRAKKTKLDEEQERLLQEEIPF